jgi:ribosomal protein S17
MHITIRNPGKGGTIALQVEPSFYIKDIKKMIKERTSVSIHDQTLEYNGRILED